MVVQGGVLVVAILFILVTLVTDLIVGWLDPRTEEGDARERGRRRAAGGSADGGLAPRHPGLAEGPVGVRRSSTVLALIAMLRAAGSRRTIPNAIDATRILAPPEPRAPVRLGRAGSRRAVARDLRLPRLARASPWGRRGGVPRRRPARPVRGVPRRMGRHRDHAADRHGARAAGDAARGRADRDHRAGQQHRARSRSR